MKFAYIIFFALFTTIILPAKNLNNKKINPDEKEKTGQVLITAPEIQNIETWINSKPLALRNMRGKIVLLDFWNYHCSSCTRTIPTLKKWHAKYKDKGLEIVSIHVPFLGVGRSPEVVASNIEWYDIKYPVALDNKFTTYSSYHIRSIPSIFVIDQDGKIIYGEEGSISYGRTENTIRKALKGLKM
jgi:thiol-disulfide isomerase/thioredoxin